MSEQKESSVLFSLKELMNLEEDRIRSEEAEKASAAAAAERARLDAERTAREAEEQRIRAEEERRRMEEQRSREEQARLEAIRVAEIEKARVEAEQRARLEAMAAQQHHERSLAAIHGDESKKSLRKILIAVAVVVPLIGIGAGVLIYQNVQENKEIAARQEAEKQALLAEKEKLERQRKEQDDKVNGLLSQLESAKDQATKDALQKQLDEERVKAENLRKNVGGGGGPRPVGGGAPKAKCTPGDPLCSDL